MHSQRLRKKHGLTYEDADWNDTETDPDETDTERCDPSWYEYMAPRASGSNVEVRGPE